MENSYTNTMRTDSKCRGGLCVPKRTLRVGLSEEPERAQTAPLDLFATLLSPARSLLMEGTMKRLIIVLALAAMAAGCATTSVSVVEFYPLSSLDLQRPSVTGKTSVPVFTDGFTAGITPADYVVIGYVLVYPQAGEELTPKRAFYEIGREGAKRGGDAVIGMKMITATEPFEESQLKWNQRGGYGSSYSGTYTLNGWTGKVVRFLPKFQCELDQFRELDER